MLLAGGMMGLLEGLLRRRELDEWRSEYTLVAARTLNQVAADVLVEAEKRLIEATWRDGLIAQGSFINERIAPLLREVAEPVAQMILEEANQSLRAIVDAQAVWTRLPEAVDSSPSTPEGLTDVAAAAGPLAAGIATIGALPAAAITTTTAWFGLGATVAVINWPVLVGGGALAGIGIATGLINASKVWEKTLARLRARVRKFVVSSLIEGSPAAPSILEQLATALSATAERAKRL